METTVKAQSQEWTWWHWCWPCLPGKVTGRFKPSMRKGISPVVLLPQGTWTHAWHRFCVELGNCTSCCKVSIHELLCISAAEASGRAHTECVGLTFITPAEKPSQPALFGDKNHYLCVSLTLPVSVRVLRAMSLSLVSWRCWKMRENRFDCCFQSREEDCLPIYFPGSDFQKDC